MTGGAGATRRADRRRPRPHGTRGAGVGHTGVSSHRASLLFWDAPEPFRCDIDQLLAVTLLNAAANEMRDRIGRALRERLTQDPEDSRLARQIALIDRAQIISGLQAARDRIRAN